MKPIFDHRCYLNPKIQILYETFRSRDRREREQSLSIIKPDAVEKSSDLDQLLDWNQAASRKIQAESSKQYEKQTVIRSEARHSRH